MASPVGNLLPLDAGIALVDVDAKRQTDGYATVYFRDRWNGLQQRLNGLAYLVGPAIELTDQHASIAPTSLILANLPAGKYAVRHYARITTPDGVSSSLTVTYAWTDSVGQTFSFPAIAGDTVTSFQSATLPLIESTGVITYATTYASNTPNQMRYRLSLTLERVG